MAQAWAGTRSRGLGHQGDKEALPTTRTRLSTLHAVAWTQMWERRPWEAGRPSVSACDLRRGGKMRDRARRGERPLDPRPGLRSGARATRWAAAERARARLRPNAGCSRCLQRPCELTFTKLSASGKPGSTISPSGLAALVAVGAFGSRGLGGAIFPGLHGSSREIASGRRDVCPPRMCKLGRSADDQAVGC